MTASMIRQAPTLVEQLQAARAEIVALHKLNVSLMALNRALSLEVGAHHDQTGEIARKARILVDEHMYSDGTGKCAECYGKHKAHEPWCKFGQLDATLRALGF